ncbi:MAG: AAA family ATPase [Polyangiaceae bacterium]|nr:AAA family ATPase [Polyangiaceae bacterium]
MENVLTEYSLGERVHQSGRTIVYRAVRLSDKAACILKIPQNEHPPPWELERLEREYETLASLHIDGVIRPYALARFRSRLALVMEDFGGVSLKQLYAAQRPTIEEVLDIGSRVARTLGQVHQQRVIHKDINPANIVRNPRTGQVKIIDFGIARTPLRDATLSRRSGVFEGTLLYMSPEQTGRMNQALDYRGDLYSLGVTLYELLAGSTPFRFDDTLALMHAHIALEPMPLHERRPDVPKALSDVIHKLLAKTPDKRHQSGRGVALDLEAIRAELGGAGTFEGFFAGKHDISSQFQLPQKLYGREAAATQLRTVFERVAAGTTEIVLISGYSGIGKTSLVSETCAPLVSARGYFATGRFEQLRRNIPYASLIDAFQEIIRQILAENQNELDRWRDKLTAALGNNAPVIAELIPNLELVVGKQPPAVTLAPTEALNRFHFAFQNFVRAFAAREHPLVLYLDDLQWADLASLNLMQKLLANPEVRHLCVIGAYRDNEISTAHPLMDMLEAVRSTGTPLTSISLTPLSVPHIVQLIDDALHCGTERAAPLATLLFQKTEGNPFFLGQLLSTLVNDRLIEFDADSGAYRWEVENIRAFGLTRDIVELMVGKIQKLAPRAQKALELAACIGNRFDIRPLSVILRCPPTEAATALQQAIDEGLLVPFDRTLSPLTQTTDDLADTFTGSAFRFLHDRVRHAAYSLLPEKDRADVHLELARFFLSSSPEPTLDEHIFDIVNQYMLGIGGISSREERYRVARLALRASRKAKSAAAFEPALRYSMTSVQILPENAFDKDHSLAIEIYTDGAETEYLNAHMEAAQQLADVAMTHSRTTLEKVNVLEMRMLFNLSRNKFEDVIRDGLDALELLGVQLPGSPTREDFDAALERNRAVLGNRPVADLALLPETKAESDLAIQRILVLLAAPAKTANPILFLLVACEHLHQCVLRGNSRFAPIAYATYGVLHAGVLADANAALAWGELAATVLERLNARQSKSNVYLLLAVLIKPWKVHVRDTLLLLREGLAAGIDTAELQFAGHCASNSCTSPLIASLPLDDVLKKQTQHVEFLTRLKHDMLRLFASIPQQTVLNLSVSYDDPSKLSGSAFDEDISTPALVQAKNFSSLCVLYTCKSMLAYMFGQYAQAVTFAEQAEANRHGLMGHPMLILQNEFQSLSLLAHARNLPEAERAAALSKVARNQAEMAGWARNAPMNFLHKWQLVEAEGARTAGRPAEAMELYESAIRNAAQANYLYDEALACERTSEACRSWGWTRASEAYLVDAHYAYLRWGATAKVASLERQYPEKLGSRALLRDLGKTETSSSQTPTGTNEVLELTSVMKASQAISSEIVLDRLVQSLLKIMLENAGARRGFFLLMRDGRLVIEAECAPDQPEKLIGGMTLAENESRMSAAIVNYVARTGETIVLSNATVSGHFTRDPYVMNVAPKSILCAPIANQGQITGVIYLENNLTEGAFTADRLEVLRLLSGQAALSIHNAKLYATLEQKVEERTRELREKNEELRATQKELVTKEKLASLGSLTAGIAHELKNPLNFVNNFAGLSVQLVDELSGEFEQQRGVIDDEALETITEAFDLLKQNVEKIENHGKRANRIISSMLQHSRNTVGERGPTDMNAVVAENVAYSVQGAQNRDPSFKLDVITSYDPNVGLVDAVAGDVGRVVLSIVENACYAVAQKKRALGNDYQPELRVSTTGEADHVEIRLRDNGTGIRPDAVDKIFMPFFTTKPPGEGTGLGLSLSHDIIVEGHRGSLSLDTRTGEFTEFIIRLPRSLRIEQ